MHHHLPALREDYPRAACDLAQAGVHLVLVQHEYGSFAGDSGSFALDLARAALADLLG